MVRLVGVRRSLMAVVVIGAAATAVQFIIDAWRLGLRALGKAQG